MSESERYTTVDCHAAGEPLRILTGWPGQYPPVPGAPGQPPDAAGCPRLAIPGRTLLEKGRWMGQHRDHVRRRLMWEPRGHKDMYGCILTEPVDPTSDLGVLFMHNEGYSTQCGHGLIGLTTVALDLGWLERREPLTELRIDTPSGPVEVRAGVGGGRVEEVTFRNVPGFVLAQDVEIELAGRRLRVDVAYGGAFYAIVSAEDLGSAVEPDRVDELTSLGQAVKEAVEATLEVRHPRQPDIRGVYGTIVTDPPRDAAHHGRNLTVFARAEVDRSPCGSGTTARLAALYARGLLGPGEEFAHESALETVFRGRIVETTSLDGRPAVITEITGRAYLTGFHTFVVDPADPLGEGFLLR